MKYQKAGGLVQHYTLRLVFVFVLFELLVVIFVVSFLMVPMAKRSAEDLAGLMALAAQTWIELPPETRPAFERELIDRHQLALRTDSPGMEADEWHMPYFYFLERALARRSGRMQHLFRERIGDGTWYWAALPAGKDFFFVGFPESRIDAHPFTALFLSLGIGFVLSCGVAIWLARRIAAPLSRLRDAADRVGEGQQPALLPEHGPREIAELARHFNRMVEQVNTLLAARTTLLAGISHDIRTPLARMRLAAEIARENPSTAALARLDADIDEINSLVSNLLELARGKVAEEAVELSLPGLIADVVGGHPNIHVDCVVDKVKVPVLALKRVLSNLVENSLRYASGSAIDIRAEPGESELVRIGVLDRGPGIPTDAMAAVLEPFHRLESSRSMTTGGTGLGLAIVRQLTEQNGWHLKLQARCGGGLEVWVELPSAKMTGK